MISKKQSILDILTQVEEELIKNIEKGKQEVVQAGNALITMDKKATEMREKVLKARESSQSLEAADYIRWEKPLVDKIEAMGPEYEKLTEVELSAAERKSRSEWVPVATSIDVVLVWY